MRYLRSLLMALMLLGTVLAIPATSSAGVVISVAIAPPALPVYVQPACPGDGYIWTPGYWAYGPDGYYWVPGTWVMAPRPGLLWTPGYWGWSGGAYIWHVGYWGPHVGFYGGVNYGFGYTGVGFYGGEWRGGHFFYNRSVSNVTITNVHVYNRTVVNNVTVNRVSFNGGPHGINARPSRGEEMAMHEHHFEETRMQADHEHSARGNREFLASVNHGRPAIAATARPGEFHGHGTVAARDEHVSPMNNHRVDNHAMNRPVPHPQNAPRSEEHARPVAHNGMNHNDMNHGSAPRPENHNNMRPQNGARPTSYHPANAPHQNAPHPQHENAPRAEHEQRGPRGH
ncbi:MAG TPA: YXWGXW repeat-containing protein [Terriglobales bacterium]|nr:YXWGXW repeat-containing protein [Terriglobales bacterium]